MSRFLARAGPPEVVQEALADLKKLWNPRKVQNDASGCQKSELLKSFFAQTRGSSFLVAFGGLFTALFLQMNPRIAIEDECSD